MSTLLTAHGLTKAFTDRPLFSGLSFSIHAGDRIGLIGPNGAGKTTLLRILCARAEADDGTVTCKKGLRVGFLEQLPHFAANATILSTLLDADPSSSKPESEPKAREYISRLGLNEFGADALVEKLSGGWKKRVALARELVKDPDILFLDEPTNHLDIESIVWLENFLSKAAFAVMTITHDRLFLQRVSNCIMELNPRHPDGILTVRGNYAAYLDIKAQNFQAQEKLEDSLRNTLRRETQWLRQGAKARTTKQQARIHRAEDLKQEVEAVSQRNISRISNLDFKSGTRSPQKLLEAKDLAKSFGEQVIFSKFNLILTPGSRVGLLGANGVGKSTLIRTLMGSMDPTSGKVFRSEQLKISYFDQTREALDLDATLAATLCPAGDHVVFQGKSTHISSYASRFLFRKEQMQVKVRHLSGGEQSRLLIARLMLSPATLLILDEPTNDLDIPTLDVLQQCLQEFEGAIVLVTHDRYFLDQVCTQLFAFPARQSTERALLAFADYGQWEAWHAAQEKSPKAAQKSETHKPTSQDPPRPRKNKLTFKDQFELDGMEAAIQKAEKTLEELNLEMGLPENISNATRLMELSSVMEKTQKEIDRLYTRWNELERKKEGFLDA